MIEQTNTLASEFSIELDSAVLKIDPVMTP